MITFFCMNIGKLIKDNLDKKNMSQADLAHKISVTPAQISRIISGERGASIETLVLIADVLGISRDTMLKIASGMSPSKESLSDEWVEEMSHKISLLPPSSRGVVSKLLDALLEESQPQTKTIKSKA